MSASDYGPHAAISQIVTFWEMMVMKLVYKSVR